MRILKIVISLMSLFYFLPALAAVDGFYIGKLKAGAALKTSQLERFSNALRHEALNVLPGPLAKTEHRAGTVIKPELRETPEGMKLVLKRFDMGELFSTVEISKPDSNDPAAWTRLCSRALREIVYGNFRQPESHPAETAKILPVAKF